MASRSTGSLRQCVPLLFFLRRENVRKGGVAPSVKTFADFDINIAGKSGIEVKTTCPKCSETRKKSHYPCLNVNTDKETWHCWHCNRSGSLRTGWSDDKERQSYVAPRHVYRKPDYQPEDLSSGANHFFAKRGIHPTILERRKIGVAKVYMPQIEEEVTAVAFPYFRDGEVINVKYRDQSKNFRMESGAERILYGYDDIAGDTLYWVEGEIDALSLEMAGYASVVSVPDGAPAPGTQNYASKFAFLDAAAEKLAPIGKHVIAVDMDAPGQCLADELARRLGPEKCWRVQWAHGCKDANEVLMRCGKDEVGRCVEAATPWPVKGIISIRQLLPKLDAMYEQGIRRGVSTGWIAMDDYYLVQPGEFTVITGVPSHGKSRWLTSLTVKLAEAYGWKFAVFSPEYSPEDFARLLVEQSSEKSFYASQERISQPDMWDAVEWADRHFCLLMPEDNMPTVDAMLDLARIQVSRMGINGVVFDPWSWIGKNVSKGQLLTHYVQDQLYNMKSFCIRYQLAFWLVAHPTKLRKATAGEYAGLYPPPTLYDISDSANFYNSADNGLCVWRNTETKSREVLIQVQKIRNEYNGQLGDVTLIYDPHTKRYYDRGLEPNVQTVAHTPTPSVRDIRGEFRETLRPQPVKMYEEIV